MKLSAAFTTTWPDELLREFARDVLKVQRFSAGYLPALRHVLGNQARADRAGLPLDQNVRAEFATVRTMKTVNHQMHAAGVVTQRQRGIGPGRSAAVYVYFGRRDEPAADLEARIRWREAEEDAARAGSLLTREGRQVAQEFDARHAALGITDADAPY